MIGPNKARRAARREEVFYPAWEETLNLHRLDFWHCNVAQRSQPGWPDYVVFGDGWLAFVELKARSINTNRVGKLRTGQERYRDSILAAGAEWKVFVFPDDWDAIDDWLESHTGRHIIGHLRRPNP